MCFVGTIPCAGNIAKGFTKSTKAVKRISKVAKGAKWIDRAYSSKQAYDIINNND